MEVAEPVGLECGSNIFIFAIRICGFAAKAHFARVNLRER
jgi:hypothetical protein